MLLIWNLFKALRNDPFCVFYQLGRVEKLSDIGVLRKRTMSLPQFIDLPPLGQLPGIPDFNPVWKYKQGCATGKVCIIPVGQGIDQPLAQGELRVSRQIFALNRRRQELRRERRVAEDEIHAALHHLGNGSADILLVDVIVYRAVGAESEGTEARLRVIVNI